MKQIGFWSKAIFEVSSFISRLSSILILSPENRNWGHKKRITVKNNFSSLIIVPTVHIFTITQGYSKHGIANDLSGHSMPAYAMSGQMPDEVQNFLPAGLGDTIADFSIYKMHTIIIFHLSMSVCYSLSSSIAHQAHMATSMCKMHLAPNPQTSMKKGTITCYVL